MNGDAATLQGRVSALVINARSALTYGFSKLLRGRGSTQLRKLQSNPIIQACEASDWRKLQELLHDDHPNRSRVDGWLAAQNTRRRGPLQIALSKLAEGNAPPLELLEALMARCCRANLRLKKPDKGTNQQLDHLQVALECSARDSKTALALVKVVINTRRAQEENRLADIYRKNNMLTKRNGKRPSGKPLPLLDTTPHNILLFTEDEEQMLAKGKREEILCHGNNAIHLIILRHEGSAFLKVALEADSPVTPRGFPKEHQSGFQRAAIQASNRGHIPLHLICRDLHHHPYPYTCVKMLLAHCPESARVATRRGRLPLHLALRTKGSKKTNHMVIDLLLSCYPEAAAAPTRNGNYALHVAIWNRASTMETIFAVLRAYPQAACMMSPKTKLYPVDLALERGLPQIVLSAILDAARSSYVSSSPRLLSTNLRTTHHLSSTIFHPACQSRASSARLARIQPALWRKSQAVQLIQTSTRRTLVQLDFHKLRSAAMIVQPWLRGCRVRRLKILSVRSNAVVVLQSWMRQQLARRIRDRRKWASDEIGSWLMEVSWIGPSVAHNRMITEIVIPQIFDEFFATGSEFFNMSVCDRVAERRDAGHSILDVLRNRPRYYPPERPKGTPTDWSGPRVLMHPLSKGQNDRSTGPRGSLDGVRRAKVRVFVRHRSATLINRTVNSWVRYVKLKRAFRPLLAFQVCRAFLRRCCKTRSQYERRLRRTVAAVRFQAIARGYIQRRCRYERRSATKLASWWRGLQQWRKYRLKRASAIRIESIQRRSSVQTKYWWVSEKRSRKFQAQAIKQGFAVRDGIPGGRAWHPDYGYPTTERLGNRHSHHAFLPTL